MYYQRIVKDSAHASCAHLPASVMVKEYVQTGGADESRLYEKKGASMRRIMSVLAVVALMAVMLVAMAATAFADPQPGVKLNKNFPVGNGRAEFCGGAPGSSLSDSTSQGVHPSEFAGIGRTPGELVVEACTHFAPLD